MPECANTFPTTPVYYLYLGHGIVTADSRDQALDVLFGRAPMPDRSDVDAWMATKDAVADTVWDGL